MFARRLAPAICGLVAVLSGCDKEKAPSPAPPASASAAAVAPASASATTNAAVDSPVTPPRPRMHTGPALLFIRSAQGLDLKDEQRTAIDKLEGQLDEGDDAKTAIEDLHQDVIAGVKAGKVENAKLEPRIAAIQKLIQTRLDKEAVTLNALYAALEPPQRATVVADVRAQQKDREDRFAKRDAGAENAADRTKRRLDRLTKELDLDATQQPKVQAILASLPPPTDLHATLKKQLDALLEAFEKEAFDAKKLDAFKPAEAKARVGIDREVQLLAQLVPILKPEQRDVLAARLEGGRQAGGPLLQGGPPHVWPFPFEEEPGTRAFWEAPSKQRKPPPVRR
jgi:Spy/CpxP family protein refolding chaperone